MGMWMTDHLDTGRDANEQPANTDAGPEQERLPWRRPVVTRIPLSSTLAGSGSPTDGFTGTGPS
jgi:hypothetical protein